MYWMSIDQLCFQKFWVQIPVFSAMSRHLGPPFCLLLRSRVCQKNLGTSKLSTNQTKVSVADVYWRILKYNQSANQNCASFAFSLGAFSSIFQFSAKAAGSSGFVSVVAGQRSLFGIKKTRTRRASHRQIENIGARDLDVLIANFLLQVREFLFLIVSVKDPVPFHLRSRVVYQFTVLVQDVIACYVGETFRHAFLSIWEGTGPPTFSNICNTEECRRLSSKSCSSILDTALNRFQLILKRGCSYPLDKSQSK